MSFTREQVWKAAGAAHKLQQQSPDGELYVGGNSFSVWWRGGVAGAKNQINRLHVE